MSNSLFVVRSLGAVSAIALGAAWAPLASAQDSGPVEIVSPDDASASSNERIIVTGARGVQRTADDSVSPVDVLSADSLESATKANVLETLNTLLPSFNLPNVATPNVESMVRAGTLRGLNPGQTLVLVYGKRRHTTAFLGAGGYPSIPDPHAIAQLHLACGFRVLSAAVNVRSIKRLFAKYRLYHQILSDTANASQGGRGALLICRMSKDCCGIFSGISRRSSSRSSSRR